MNLITMVRCRYLNSIYGAKKIIGGVREKTLDIFIWKMPTVCFYWTAQRRTGAGLEGRGTGGHWKREHSQWRTLQWMSNLTLGCRINAWRKKIGSYSHEYQGLKVSTLAPQKIQIQCFHSLQVLLDLNNYHLLTFCFNCK